MNQQTLPRANTPSPGGAATSIGWAGSALFVTGLIAVGAKVFGVLIAPGMRGNASARAVEICEWLSAAFAYTLAGLLVALVCGASFDLARARKISVAARGGVVAVSGLVVALASPAVVQRLHTLAALALAVVTGIIALVAGIVAARAPQTRITGAVLGVLAICAILRVVGWETATVAADRPGVTLHQVARTFATAAVIVQAVATLLAAAWLGVRAKWHGRIAANAAIVLAFVITYLAAREPSGSSSTVEAVLRGSLTEAVSQPAPYAIGTIAAFLVPTSILLAIVALTRQPASHTAPLAFALLSNGAFDVPLQALLVTAASQWAMLAMTDDRAMWAGLVRDRNERIDENAARQPGRGNA